MQFEANLVFIIPFIISTFYFFDINLCSKIVSQLSFYLFIYFF